MPKDAKGHGSNSRSFVLKQNPALAGANAYADKIREGMAFYHGSTNPNPGRNVPTWYTSDPRQASSYAMGVGGREGANVLRRDMAFKNPYVAKSHDEIANATAGTIEKLKAQGYDAMIHHIPGSEFQAKFLKKPELAEPRTWAIPFESE